MNVSSHFFKTAFSSTLNCAHVLKIQFFSGLISLKLGSSGSLRQNNYLSEKCRERDLTGKYSGFLLKNIFKLLLFFSPYQILALIFSGLSNRNFHFPSCHTNCHPSAFYFLNIYFFYILSPPLLFFFLGLCFPPLSTIILVGFYKAQR